MTQDLKTKIAEAIVQRRRDLAMRSGGPIIVEPIDTAETALQAIHDAGFAVVPLRPTLEMTTAGYETIYDYGHDTYAEIWRAMLQASQPKTEEG